MSTPKLGEFFTSLVECALERCEHPSPSALRRQLGALLHLTLGYAPREWVEQTRSLGGDHQARSLLLAQLDHHLMPLSPSWLDRVQLKSMLQAALRLFQATWLDRHDLTREVCHIFSLSTSELFSGELSEVAAIAPHLHSMLLARAWHKRNTSDLKTSLSPLPQDLTALMVYERRDDYWSILCERDGLRLTYEARYFQHPLDVSEALKRLEKKVQGWQAITRSGSDGNWVWLERPASLNLGLLTHHNEPIGPEHAVLNILPILRALSEMHDRGEVCGSLRPSALSIEPGGKLLLGDRLLWSLHRTPSVWPRSDEMMYWAPELFREGAQFTPQSDLWSVGLILYQLLCGPLPWSGLHRPDRLIRAILRADHRTWSRTPSELQSFIARCLAPDPKQRWVDASQALERLNTLAERLSPLLRGQRLSEQWTHILSTNVPQRFLEQTPILPSEEPERALSRFLSAERGRDIGSGFLAPLFPGLTELHAKWWSNHALTQETLAQQEASLETFRHSLTEISPAFLFEQLTILSKQKETLEQRYREALISLERERLILKKEVLAHAEQVLTRLWMDLGLSPDLLPKWSTLAEDEHVETESLIKDEKILAPEELEHAEEDLRREVHTLSPEERIQRFDELSARMKLIESSRPMSIPLPEVSRAPADQVVRTDLPLEDDLLSQLVSEDEEMGPARPSVNLMLGRSSRTASIPQDQNEAWDDDELPDELPDLFSDEFPQSNSDQQMSLAELDEDFDDVDMFTSEHSIDRESSTYTDEIDAYAQTEFITDLSLDPPVIESVVLEEEEQEGRYRHPLSLPIEPVEESVFQMPSTPASPDLADSFGETLTESFVDDERYDPSFDEGHHIKRTETEKLAQHENLEDDLSVSFEASFERPFKDKFEGSIPPFATPHDASSPSAGLPSLWLDDEMPPQVADPLAVVEALESPLSVLEQRDSMDDWSSELDWDPLEATQDPEEEG